MMQIDGQKAGTFGESYDKTRFIGGYVSYQLVVFCPTCWEEMETLKFHPNQMEVFELSATQDGPGWEFSVKLKNSMDL